MQAHSGLNATLRSIADEVETTKGWHQVSRSLGRSRFATVCGSAPRVREHSCYEMARERDSSLAERAWAWVTGGGPGIIQAVRDRSGDIRFGAVCIGIATSGGG